MMFVNRLRSAIRGLLDPTVDISIYQVGLNNENSRHKWVRTQLENVPNGWRLLDAGAGICQYRPFCAHLEYIAQDFGEYRGTGNGSGLQTGQWDVSNIDIVCDITE